MDCEWPGPIRHEPGGILVSGSRCLRWLRSACLAAVVVVGCSACTLEEVARWSIASVFPVEEQDTAVRIARCESGFNPQAVGFRTNFGVFQINIVHKGWLEDEGFNWEEVQTQTYANVLAAYRVWERAGNSWRPWSCR